jgi:CarD family transcriptional regulator
MNLDNQNVKSERLSEATDASSASPGAREKGDIPAEFNAADFVVYPAHGVGQILSIEETTVAGASLEFYVIYFTKSKMTLRVPVRKPRTSECASHRISPRSKERNRF